MDIKNLAGKAVSGGQVASDGVFHAAEGALGVTDPTAGKGATIKFEKGKDENGVFDIYKFEQLNRDLKKFLPGPEYGKRNGEGGPFKAAYNTDLDGKKITIIFSVLGIASGPISCTSDDLLDGMSIDVNLDHAKGTIRLSNPDPNRVPEYIEADVNLSLRFGGNYIQNIYLFSKY